VDHQVAQLRLARQALGRLRARACVCAQCVCVRAGCV
jgi:hypothetical protein